MSILPQNVREWSFLGAGAVGTLIVQTAKKWAFGTKQIEAKTIEVEETKTKKTGTH